MEIGNSGVWSTVSVGYRFWSGWTRWSLTDADIVCRMLTYRNASWTGRVTVSGNDLKTVFSRCKANETSLEYCEHYPSRSYSDLRDIEVRCSSHQGKINKTTFDSRSIWQQDVY